MGIDLKSVFILSLKVRGLLSTKMSIVEIVNVYLERQNL